MSMTITGATEAGDTVTYWVIYDDGSVGRIEITNGQQEPALSKPGRLVSEVEYQERLDELRAEQERRRAERAAEDEARTRTDYLALRAAGVPEDTARRMSGYTGPAIDPDES
ncbi:hypothetical protein SJI45_19180 [Streptomyces sp. S399]|uniref:hypothetical protein n=1 Tax=Streptomyces sp. S399 TaxID=3096009 RepID=UPI002A82A685|nr:hypothetical protein [Streptomyces sp. S399]WPR52861.1 hypothetical protein SJI45_19180 [Streptomyces sp. S399]